MSHLKFDQQLLGLTLRVNPWLWNWAQYRLQSHGLDFTIKD